MRKTPVVLGVLSIIFGGLVALMSAGGLLLQRHVRDFSSELVAMNSQQHSGPDPSQMMSRISQVQQELAPVFYTISGGMVALSLILVAVGLGLYRRQPWSRPATIMWSVAALAFLPVQMYLQIAIVQPRMMAAIAETAASSGLPGGMMSSMMGMQKGVVVLTTLLFYAPFPVILLTLMGRSSARNDLVS